jgi:hypothetical protein
MEGQRDVYKKDKGKVVAMLPALLDNAFGLSDDEPQISDDTSLEIHDPPILDNVHIIPHMAHQSVSSSSIHEHNENIEHDLYLMCDHPEPLAYASVADVDPTAFHSLGRQFNSCLDLGYTNHIITDRKLFHTYDKAGAVDVSTANCGSLSAIASGDVIFCLPFGGRFVLFTLCCCLHAPDTPINLLSVGALNKG